MSTRSTIGVVRCDGSKARIYCHWDGYLEHNGVILYESYSDMNRLEQLLRLGNISSLGENLEEENSTFDNPAPNTVIAYHRDRGEEWDDCHSADEDFNYTFHENGGYWTYHEWDEYDKERSLEEDLKKYEIIK